MAEEVEERTVLVHYKGTLDDGIVFDTTIGGEPFEFTIGTNSVIPAFEKTVVEMKTGETKNVKIPAEEAYGPFRDDLLRVVDKSELPDTTKIMLGMTLQASGADGDFMNVVITNIDEENGKVTLDANHALAGKDLNFEIKMLA